MTLLEKGVIELRNVNICVKHNLSDLLKPPPRDDVVEADGGNFMGVMESFRNKSLTEWPT